VILVLDDLKGKSQRCAELRKIAVIHLLRRLAGAGTIRRWLLMCAGDVTSCSRNDMKPTWDMAIPWMALNLPQSTQKSKR
ncbi:hypothetical protein, partial [Succinimonas sp.]|uniref:hypothetical protein n=1 Tax=Succinimonas sp. TaxID=1936151 RepID=UPI0038643AB6